MYVMFGFLPSEEPLEFSGIQRVRPPLAFLLKCSTLTWHPSCCTVRRNVLNIVAGSDEFPINLQTLPSKIVRKAQFEEEGARIYCGGGL